METFFLRLPILLFVLIAGLLLIKLTLFFTFRTRNWKLINIFYFDLPHITLTESNKRVSVKKWQNTLTLVMVILIVLEILIKMIIK